MGKKNINSERSVLVSEVRLELVDLSSESIWAISMASNDSNTARVGDSCCKGRACSNAHTRQHDRVLYAKDLGQMRSNLLWNSVRSREEVEILGVNVLRVGLPMFAVVQRLLDRID